MDAFLPTDRETGRPRGFAFVTFANDEQAKACIEKFNRADLGGRALNINEAEERPRRGPPRGGRPGGGGGYGGPRGGPPEPMEPASDWNELRGGDWRGEGEGGGESDGSKPSRPAGGGHRSFGEDAKPGSSWDSKKRKRGRGSRRGLRAKKRSL